MGKTDKLKERLLSRPKDFTNDEAERLLKQCGYEKDTKGKTSGSRMAYINKETGAVFLLHRAHPGNELKRYVIDQLIQHLREHEFL